MFTIKPLPGFTSWLDGLSNSAVRGVVVARIKRLERGLMGDAEPVGKGVSELRIHLGAGWRVYFTQRGTQTIVKQERCQISISDQIEKEASGDLNWNISYFSPQRHKGHGGKAWN